MKLIPVITAVSTAALAVLSANAAPLTWTGNAADGDLFRTAGNWSPTQIPGSNDDVSIGFGAVQYVPPAAGGTGDLSVKSFTLSGGSFTQSSGTNFFQFADRSVTVTGGAFSMGTSTGFIRSTLSTLTVSGGSVSLNSGYTLSGSGTTNVSGTGILSIAGNYTYNNTVNATDSFSIASGTTFNVGGNLGYSRSDSTATFLNGGNVNVTGEFQTNGVGTRAVISSGNIVAKLVSYGNGSTSGITLSGGSLSVDYDATSNGFFNEDTSAASTSGRYVNFVGTGGTVILRNSTDNLLTQTQINSYLNNNFRFNGVQSAASFSVATVGTSLVVTAVPEPTTLATLGLAATGLLARRRK